MPYNLRLNNGWLAPLTLCHSFGVNCYELFSVLKSWCIFNYILKLKGEPRSLRSNRFDLIWYIPIFHLPQSWTLCSIKGIKWLSIPYHCTLYTYTYLTMMKNERWGPYIKNHLIVNLINIKSTLYQEQNVFKLSDALQIPWITHAAWVTLNAYHIFECNNNYCYSYTIFLWDNNSFSLNIFIHLRYSMFAVCIINSH